ncbi:hypothetical protein OG402_38305 [Streptomyces anulatus]|uniref:hypothetical protein n=1 Tax=Streptomyces anulatus TaxID=1892 RepID=UPI0022516EBF|nr:hypothetical protein [Streptomyces anulatus]MCX4516064.1 hypothetical protein [Streptomyces anulatus]MCX4523293.1 hypothetical protein [Streptomyces anulatus]MCX4598891.1 hypothetical protein [Streptomyces anulatus]MCX4606303.1 hypothetical protein [Streptomyces anulatus]WSU71427.1 hypothetical protein OG499_00040 [Streptomyces anulatus]
MAVFPNLVPVSVTAVSGLATAMAGAPWWGVVICLVLTLAATSVQALFPQDSPDRLTWWTNHREHRLLRRTQRDGNRPGPRS